jgi:hypothetical protein
MRIKLLLLLLLSVCWLKDAFSQVSIQHLYFNSTSNILRLNFSGSAPTASYTGISSGAPIGEGIAHAEDQSGNLQFWVNASGVYDKNGTLMPGSAGILAHPSSTEIVICPFPAEKDKFYIFYNNQLCSELYFAVVDIRLRSGLGEVISKNTVIDAGNSYAEGLEIVKIPCSADYWLLSYQCYRGFTRFRIGTNGISAPTLMATYNTDGHNGRGELDYHEGRLGYALTYRNRAFLATFNPVTGELTGAQTIMVNATNGLYGLEFSPDASKVFFTDWHNRNFFGNIVSPNLYRYDFTTGATSSWTIPYNNTNCRNTTVDGLGQIELGKDGKLYIPHVNGCQITVVDNPNVNTPTLSLIDVNTTLSTGVSDHIQSEFYQPQILMATASKNTVCAGEEVQLIATGGAGTYSWLPATGLTSAANGTVTANPMATTTYKVYAENTYGCRDSASVTVTVQAIIKPQIKNTTPASVCPRHSLTLQASTGPGTYSWYINWQLLPHEQKDSLVIEEAGVYQVSLQSSSCPALSDEYVVEAALFAGKGKLLVPNVITPDNDPQQANETFQVQNYSGTIRLVICNRWGKEIYRNDNYQNTWNAAGLANGIYYYQLSHADNCFPVVRGIVHVLR